ncbi:killer cell lectin-like receptor 2 [Ochotona curzoniae]|uniref:killer cell lectin-like receptor 2 n=1 Tax=Ochotona curzoniae TaxID=130825 RepID=UPI001B34B9A0|nr:killer cell lectin-like receptor 2 [Ochotona curzoniae]XP_040822772.1 killer cell lectin-like receptor 2 [Ochotona curzoniae]
MSNQEVTYSALRFLQASSSSQRRSKPDGTRTGEKEFSVPWHLIAVTLGILCLILLMIVLVLGTKYVHLIQEKHEQQEILGNLSQKYSINEQLLANKTLEYDRVRNESFLPKNKLASSLKKEGCCAKGPVPSKSLQNPGKLSEDYWSCFDVSCYYFVHDNKNWHGCKQTCQYYHSSLLKIDNEQEQEFIQVQIGQNRYWIGLSYDEKERKWKWVDTGSSTGVNFAMMSLPSRRGECALLSSTKVTPIDCSKTYSCICEKEIDCVFRASVCT